MIRTIFATPAVLVLVVASDSARAGYAPAVGVRPPDFTLPNIADGKPVSLSNATRSW
jgi:hypothetical protein